MMEQQRGTGDSVVIKAAKCSGLVMEALEEPGVAAATEVIRGPMGSHSTQREQAAQVPGIKIIITLH